ncbi:MAG: GreA/GreB family elongation factor [Pseudomonadota bacterium]
MSVSVVPRRIFESLINHLIKIEDERLNVVDRYYPEWNDGRRSFQELLDSYISRMEKIIYNELKVDDSTSAVCPYVLIGSKLELENIHTALKEEIQIVSPFTGIIDFEVASASYLSPMGRAFLLRKVNDTVSVETPMGVMQYRINAIKPPDDIPQFY